MKINDDFKYEYWKFTGNTYSGLKSWLKTMKSHTLKVIYFGRKEQYSKGFRKKFYGVLKKTAGIQSGIEIPDFSNVGKGIMLCHAFGITLNENAKLGEDVTIFKGVTIGGIRSGKRAGAPMIGNRVVVGANGFVGGNIKIGNDVMIAPGAYVNFNVPNNSLVIGNPGVIHKKQNAADDYFTAFAAKKCSRAIEENNRDGN